MGFFVLVSSYIFKFFPITEGFRHSTLFKKRYYTGVFPWILQNFSEHLVEHLLVAAFTVTKIFGLMNVALAGLLNFSQFKKKMKKYLF